MPLLKLILPFSIEYLMLPVVRDEHPSVSIAFVASSPSALHSLNAPSADDEQVLKVCRQQATEYQA